MGKQILRSPHGICTARTRQSKRNVYREVVQELAAKYGKTPAQILLRRTVQDGATVIPKSVNLKHIRENIDIFDFELTSEEMSALRSLDKAAPMIGNPEKPELVEMAMQW